MRCSLALALLLVAIGAQAASRSQDGVQRNGTLSRSQVGDQKNGTLPVFDHPVTAEQLARDLGPMTATLREAQILRGQFSQKKTLSGVPHPLLAEGSFLFARGRGIVWRTLKPFDSALVITQKEIIQRDSGGTALRMSAGADAVAGSVSQTYFAVFSLDFKTLESQFVLHSRRVGKGWELGLLPRQGMGGAITRIVVSGAAKVDRVILQDRHGDETDIQLRHTVVSAEPPTAAEAQQFK